MGRKHTPRRRLDADDEIDEWDEEYDEDDY